MNTSEQINDLAAALAKAQAEIQNAVLNKTNPHFKSRYADLAAVREAVTPALTKHGLSVVQMTGTDDSRMVVYTRLLHSSGQWVQSAYPIISDTSKPQAMGSALTYARRYSLAAMCGIASEEDDDGNAAQEHGKNHPHTEPVMAAASGTKGASKSGNREVYDRLTRAIRNATTVASLKTWYEASISEIDALPPDWLDELRIEYQDRMSELKKALAA